MSRQITVPTTGLRRIAIVIVVAAVLVVGWRGWTEGWPPFGPSDDQWTGVFLTNGQAYFGHFYAGPGDYAKLREVYYVLATQLQSQDPKVPSSTQLSLQKLGGEIHGPTQEMKISKQQILFTEELRPDSPVVQSIAQLKSGGGAAPQAPATTVPAPATPAPATSAPAASPSRSPSPTPSATR